MKVNFRTSLREADKEPKTANGGTWQVVLIQEGLGNLKDCFYYTKQCLQNSSTLFEGKKCYADHPSMLEENIRPERSTRDILGYYQNVAYQEDASGRGQLVADLVTLADPSISWANALLSNSIQYAQNYPNSDFVGLSINASGEANEVPLTQFISQTQIPDSVMPKIQEAVAQGVDSVRVVSALQDAMSCDLVTDAGAGGKILKMIEQAKGRKSMATGFKEKKSHETEKKESTEKKKESGIDPKDNLAEAGINPKDNLSEADEDGTGMDPNAMATGAQPDHADAGQDVAMFKQLISQYLGDGSGVDEAEAMPMAQHAYQASREAGMEHEAAMEAAGNHLKMAHEVGKRMHQSQSKEAGGMEHECKGKEACEHESHKEAFPPAKSGTPPAHSAPSAPPAPPAHVPPANPQQMPKAQIEKYYESMRKQLIEQHGVIAGLRESLNRYELTGYLNKKMSESKLPNTITKKFREACGVVKTKGEIDKTWNSFVAGLNSATEEVSRDYADCVFTEKNQSRPTSSAEGFSDGFGDCT